MVAHAVRRAARQQEVLRTRVNAIPEDYRAAVYEAIAVAELFAAGGDLDTARARTAVDGVGRLKEFPFDAEMAAGSAQKAALAAYEALRGAVPDGNDVFSQKLAAEHGKEVWAQARLADQHLPGSDLKKPGRDLEKLLSLGLGNFPELGDPVDTSDHGSLGPL
jgi:hypothetical protein